MEGHPIVSGYWAVRMERSSASRSLCLARLPIFVYLPSLRLQRLATRERELSSLIAGAMFLATLWFLYVQAFLLHAYCRYCLFSAALTFLIAGLLIALPPERNRSVP